MKIFMAALYLGTLSQGWGLEQYLSPLSQEEAHKQGHALALIQQKKPTLSTSSANEVVPHFTANPSGSGLHAGSIGEAAKAALGSDEVGQYVKTQSDQRSKHLFDPDVDPIFTNANKAVMDPQKTLDVMVMEEKGGTVEKDTVLTCMESGDEYLQTCMKHRVMETKITPQIIQHVQRCNGHRESRACGTKHVVRWYDGCGCGSYYQTVQERRVDIVRDQWIDGCQVLEGLADKGLCACLFGRQGAGDACFDF